MIKHRYLVGLVLFAFIFFFAANSTDANAKQTVIPKSQMTQAYKGNLQKKATQGSVVTQDYYVYTDWQSDNSKGIVHIVRRSDNREVAKISGNWGHMSALDHKWGTNYVRIINNDNANKDGCIDLSTKKTTSLKHCPARTSKATKKKISSGISSSLQQQAAPIKFNNYYFKTAYNKSGNKAAYIYVFDKNGKKLKTFQIPRKNVDCAEIEDMSIDGNTGDVYISYNCNSGGDHIRIYKVNQSALGDFTKADSTSIAKNPSTSNTKNTNTTNTTSTSNTKNGSKPVAESGADGIEDTTADQEEDSKSGGSVETIILQTTSIEGILQLVVSIMSIGVPILGVIGISFFGIQYMTAAGDTAKTQKAKRRMVEVIIGLVIYAISFSILFFLRVA